MMIVRSFGRYFFVRRMGDFVGLGFATLPKSLITSLRFGMGISSPSGVV